MTALFRLLIAATVVASATSGPAVADEVLNIYSSRHYDTDERLYRNFEEATGIEINRLEDKADALIARIRAEGRRSPADLLITVDAGRLWQADQQGLFQPVDSDFVERRVPSYLRHQDGHWFGFSTRARVIFYDKRRLNAGAINTYQDLAKPDFEGMVCTRSASNIYMLSLLASLIHHLGEPAATEWARKVWANRARDPQGGDTDQLRAIASGECGIALANTYYYARALRKPVRGLAHPEDTQHIGIVFPNQSSFGTHVNISGAGVLKHAPNADNAVRFLEYLARDEAQQYFSAGNDEYPAVPGVALAESVAQLGTFKPDDIDLEVLGQNQALAQRIYDRVGYE